jgi:hypothetical protein
VISFPAVHYDLRADSSIRETRTVAGHFTSVKARPIRIQREYYASLWSLHEVKSRYAGLRIDSQCLKVVHQRRYTITRLMPAI